MRLLLSLCISCLIFQPGSTEVCNSDNDCKYQECIQIACADGWGGYKTWCHFSKQCVYQHCNNNQGYCPARPCYALPGYYCSPSTLCPENNYCTGGTAPPTACPPGQKGPVGLSNSTGCYIPCLAPIGKYCQDIKVNIQSDCPVGFYCQGGETSPIACPPGQNGTLNQAPLPICTNYTDMCTEGMYQSSPTNCTRCTTTPCKPGTYRTYCGKKAISDSVCANCSNAPSSGLFNWTSQCEFRCSDGHNLTMNNTCAQYLQFDRPPPGGGYQLVPIMMQGGAAVGFVDRLGSNRVYARFTANNVLRFQHAVNATILAVGGGGAGATYRLGGGGAGAAVMVQGVTLTHGKTYTVEVGAGGLNSGNDLTGPGALNTGVGAFGKPSRVSSEGTTLVLALGGGAGSSGNGGCGGGNFADFLEGTYIQPIGMALSTNVPAGVYGFEGGASQSALFTIAGGRGSSGGGGAGGPGGVPSPITNVGGDGGAAIVTNLTGTPVVFAGGGGGSTSAGGWSKGGGAVVNGQMVYVGGGVVGIDGINGVPGTGSGGSTGHYAGGNGGSGTVIMVWDAVFLACENNTYSPAGATACIQCMDGMISPARAARCTCYPGEFRNMSINKCIRCSEPNCTSGQITRACGLEADSACITCRSGTFAADRAACDPCPVNSQSADGSRLCTCDPALGYYMHNTTLNACLSCPRDHSCPSSNAAAIPCGPGFQRPSEQLPIDSCHPCTNMPVVGNYTWNPYITCDPQCSAGFYTLDSGEERFCLSCFQNYTDNNSPTCAPGMYMPICAKGSTRKQSCAYCPTPPPPGAVWAGICGFVCGDGLYYNSTTALCTACSHPQCRPGESATACTKDADSTCEQCTDGPLNGPFEWTHGCAFSCSNATFYNETNNRTCSEQPVAQTTDRFFSTDAITLLTTKSPSTPSATTSSQQGTASGTMSWQNTILSSTPRNTTAIVSSPIPPNTTTILVSTLPNTTTTLTPIRSNITTTPSSTTTPPPTITVFVQTKTDITLNNTVKQVCANLDSLVSIVVGAMQETFGIPFEGNVSTINNKTVANACTNVTTRRLRRLLLEPTQTNQNVTVSTRSLEQITEEKATVDQSTDTTSNTIIQTRLNNQSELRATSVDTSVNTAMSETPPPTPTPKTMEPMSIGVYIILVLLGITCFLSLVGGIVYCIFYRKTHSQGLNITRNTGSHFHHGASCQYSLMPRIDKI